LNGCHIDVMAIIKGSNAMRPLNGKYELDWCAASKKGHAWPAYGAKN
jgi:hypothetical protein